MSADPVVDAWNTRHPIGTWVYAWPGAMAGAPPLMSRTRTPAWLVSGQPCVSVDGYPGGIALTHVLPAPPPGMAMIREYGLRDPDGRVFCGNAEGVRWDRQTAEGAAEHASDDGTARDDEEHGPACGPLCDTLIVRTVVDVAVQPLTPWEDVS